MPFDLSSLPTLKTVDFDTREVSPQIVGWIHPAGAMICRACMLPDGDTSDWCPVYRNHPRLSRERCDFCGNRLS
jgi:hypothetical protein